MCRCKSLQWVLGRCVLVCEGICVHAGGLLLLPAGGLVLGVCLNPGTGGLSATLSCELGMHILLLALGKWKVVWPMGAGETPAAPRDTLAMSCRHRWQGWGVPAGEELCSGSLHQPLSCSPCLQGSAWTCCIHSVSPGNAQLQPWGTKLHGF